MIKYKIDVYEKLMELGINTTAAKNSSVFSQSVMQKFKDGDTSVTIDCINKLCSVLKLSPSDILEYVETEKDCSTRNKALSGVKIERRIYKLTLGDIRQYVYLMMKRQSRLCFMIEQNDLNNPDSLSSIYADRDGYDKPYCSAFMFGESNQYGTFLVAYEVTEKYDYFVDYDTFCQMMYDYIQKEYRDMYLTND